MRNALFALLSVLMISAGQVMFKKIGLLLASGARVLDVRVVAWLATAFTIYACATLLWISVLRTMPLTRAYPYMALSFIVVPIASLLFYGERMDRVSLIGIALIVTGVLMIASRGQ